MSLTYLKKLDYLNVRLQKAPIKLNLKLQVAKAEEIKDKERYQKLVEGLVYLSHTHPDITHVVCMDQFILKLKF